MASNKENSEREDLYLDFDKLNVNELKSYLRDHGQYVSGVKSELIKRAKGTDIFRQRPLSELVLEDRNFEERRNLERFVTPLGETLPHPSSLKQGWIDDCEQIPDFTNTELYNYLVLSQGRTVDKEKNNAKRQLKAKVFYEDRHVHSVQYHNIAAKITHCYVRAKVIPSMPTLNEKKKPDYLVWISMSKVTGHVHGAGRECSAGYLQLPEIHSITFNYADSIKLDSEKCTDFFQTYRENQYLCDDDCEKTERLTRGQSKNKLWKKARVGRVTSSNFEAICKYKNTEPESLIKTVMAYNNFTNASVRWGRDHEPAARRKYVLVKKAAGNTISVTDTGLYVQKNLPFLGSSPDGLVDDNGNIGVLEVKCPFKWRFSKIVDACTDSQFCCEMNKDKVILKRSHNYYYQVQAQMALTNSLWCDFVVWTLCDISIERIAFNKQFWQECLVKVINFYQKFVLPELFSCRVQRGKRLYD
ncbi:hypothetical protein LOTGIDRAFT_165431 [Lottia gigantea]|uniref:SAP domain-containing protein n=1 Tax=Lottia gigantea TaxID=225164 RepID=V3ZW85_LOTGI|nr:hypothetical protein LOTGIDRAFT_165431 [Lottia gigantea]ESO88647.1 hypothetical protein LOTGIDRAFT_165431 [Lottia gigantea]